MNRKMKKFNGDEESEVIFDNRTVKEGKLPSEVMTKETTVSTSTAAPKPKPKPIRPKATPLSEPRVDGKTFTETIAKSRVPAPKETKAEMAKPDPSPGALGFKGLRSFLSGLGKPYGADKYEKEARMKKGLEGEGAFKKGGKVSSASKRADGCAIRGKTRA
jgi:hypothetical protein